MKKSISFAGCGLAVLLFSFAAHAEDFELDRGMGQKRNNDVESWFDNRESSHTSTANPGSQFEQNNLGLALGNVISIETKPGSHVVLNASQINKANQVTEVTLKGANNKKYKNVEEPIYKDDNYLQYSQ